MRDAENACSPWTGIERLRAWDEHARRDARVDLRGAWLHQRGLRLTYFWGEYDAIRKAERVRNAGGVAFLLIDSAMVGNPKPSVAMPNHWISFLGGPSRPTSPSDSKHIRGDSARPLTSTKKRSRTTCGALSPVSHRNGA